MSIATAVLEKVRANSPQFTILDGVVPIGQGVASPILDEPYGVVFCTNGNRERNGVARALDSRMVDVILHSFAYDREGAEDISDQMTDALLITPTEAPGFQPATFREHERRPPRPDEDVPGRTLVMIVDTLRAQFVAV